MNAVLDNARSLDAPPDLAVDGRVQATLNDSRLRIAASATNEAGLRAQTDLDLPAEASAKPFRLAINRTQPLRGTFSAQGELRSLWDLFFGAERTLSGKLAASGNDRRNAEQPPRARRRQRY
jgi:translocation and assembly module TamB